ncbi:ClpP/crotonase-like domain-containing protein [Russula aff. rugulosa BPL654]|nr:ClpP/crotonase-like domain-containing protein [Russula aff. rugulosa BPL654]
MSFINTSLFRATKHPFTTLRFFSAVNTHEAFLQSVQSHPGVTTLSLNRPHAKNAISLQLLKQFTDCLDTVRFDDSVRVLILDSSTPGSFCSGADLAERRTMTKGQVSKFLTDLRTALGKLESLPMPTIAAIDGPALGGGLELALACDLRVAGHSVTKIGLPETKLGIIPGAGGTQRATRILGLSKAKDLIFTGRSLTAAEAEELGLVDYVSEEGTPAMDRALSLAEKIAANAPIALRSAKLAISRAQELSLESGKLFHLRSSDVLKGFLGLDFERAAYEPLLQTKDREEALQAFREKRKPVFKGE